MIAMQDRQSDAPLRMPTPTAGDSKSARNSTANRRKIPPTGIHAGDTLTDYVTKWPTPRARDWKGPGYEDDLPTAVQTFPTPTASEHTGPGHSTKGGKNFRTVVAEREQWATPTAHPRTHTPRQVDHGRQLANEVGGQLNPTWVEWLMGFPLEWTVCELSATRSSRRSRSGSADGSSTTKKDG